MSLSGPIAGAAAQSFGPASSYSAGAAGSTLYALTLGDVTGDGRPDIVAPDFNSGSVQVLPGQAGGSFGASSTYPGRASGGPQGVALGDVSGDGRPDIVAATGNDGTLSVLLNTGTYAPLAAGQAAVAGLSLAPNPAHEAFTVQLPALPPARPSC